MLQLKQKLADFEEYKLKFEEQKTVLEEQKKELERQKIELTEQHSKEIREIKEEHKKALDQSNLKIQEISEKMRKEKGREIDEGTEINEETKEVIELIRIDSILNQRFLRPNISNNPPNKKVKEQVQKLDIENPPVKTQLFSYSSSDSDEY